MKTVTQKILKREFNSFLRKLSFQMSFASVYFSANKLRSLRGGSQKHCGIKLLELRIAGRLETCELRTRVEACLRHSRGSFNDLEELAIVFAGYRADV